MIPIPHIPTPGEIADVAAARGRLSRLAWAWDGLIRLYLPMARCQGAQLLDWSGSRHHATLVNMDPATDWIGTRHGTALHMTADTGDDRVDFDAPIAFDSGVPWTAWTLLTMAQWNTLKGFWGYDYEYTKYTRLMSWTSTTIIDLANDANGRAEWTDLPNPTGVPLSLVVSHDGTNVTLYMDGVSKGAKPKTGTYTHRRLNTYGGAGANIGIDADWHAHAIWSRALSAGEVAELYAKPYGLVTARRRVSTFSAPAGGGSAIPALTRYYRNRRCA